MLIPYNTASDRGESVFADENTSSDSDRTLVAPLPPGELPSAASLSTPPDQLPNTNGLLDTSRLPKQLPSTEGLLDTSPQIQRTATASLTARAPRPNRSWKNHVRVYILITFVLGWFLIGRLEAGFLFTNYAGEGLLTNEVQGSLLVAVIVGMASLCYIRRLDVNIGAMLATFVLRHAIFGRSTR